jgi:hypothetical protein
MRACDGLTHGEVWALIRLSGYTDSSSFHGIDEGSIQSLLNNGLVRELQTEEAIQLKQRLLSFFSIPFGPMPQSRMRILSNAGKASLFRILDAAPGLKQHFLATRVVGQYVHQYFSNIDQAIQAKKRLKESGKYVTNIERIGRWCYYWWDVHSEGARFSYWTDDIA